MFIVSTTVQVLFVWTLFNMQNSDHAIEKFVRKRKRRKKAITWGGLEMVLFI